LTKKPALRSLISALWLMLVVLCLPGSAAAAQKNVKAKDIAMTKCDYYNNKIVLKFANRTNKTVTIGEWAGCWYSGSPYCSAALHLISKNGKRIASYKIPKKQTRTIYFKIPKEIDCVLNEVEYDDAYFDKFIFNFAVGKSKKTCTMKHSPKLDHFGDKGKYTSKNTIKSGYKDIPYKTMLQMSKAGAEPEEVYATYANYIKVKVGMTYQQVSQIFGFYGKQGSNINGYITYNWDGPDYSYAYITFYAGKVVSTFQYGLN